MTPPPPAPGGRDVYVYFDNDVKVRAPFDAMALAARVGAGPLPSAGASPPQHPDPAPRTRGPAP